MPEYWHQDSGTVGNSYNINLTTGAAFFPNSPCAWASGTVITYTNVVVPVGNCDAFSYYPPWSQPDNQEEQERAEKLLLESLNEAQRVMYSEAKKFLVRGGETGREYEISKGRARNIRVTDDGGVRRTLCAHPVDGVPDCDTMLAQKLMLEHCEREFLSIANVS